MLSEATKRVLKDILDESGNGHLVDENGEAQLLALLLKMRDKMTSTSPTLKSTVHESINWLSLKEAKELLGVK